MNESTNPIKPIFLHSGLRNGSTYIWNKFRSDSRVMGFYEPFQQTLTNVDIHFLRTLSPKTWNSKHPDMEPYFQEYEPLLNPNGVGIQGFQPEFSFVNYFRTRDEIPDQRAYLDSLIHHAIHQDKIPVLGFSKSIGRVEWLKRHFPEAIHITTIRNPLHQWLSGYHFYTETKNANFLTYCMTCIQNPGDNLYIQSIHHGMKDILFRNHFPLSTFYEAFLHVYGSSTITALPYSDLVLDIDRMSNSKAYQSFVEHRIKDLTKIPVDFSDCRIKHYDLPDIGVEFQKINQTVLNSLLLWMEDVKVNLPNVYERNPFSILEKIETSIASSFS